MRETGLHSRRARLRCAGVYLVAGALAALLGACGSSGSRQDSSEPSGKFPVEITTSQFPSRQRLAQTEYLKLGVKNTGQNIIQNLAITISADKDAIRPFSIRDPQTDLAAPDRPIWVLDNNWPRLVGASSAFVPPTANEKTYDLGQLNPGQTTEAAWKVVPVRPGSYRLSYGVDAGLNGKAQAVTADGSKPTGSFVVEISSQPPRTAVNGAGQVVLVHPNQQPGASP